MEMALKALAERVQKIRSSLATEEAAKTALVLPFIQILGYDIFNPAEVVPEFSADVADLKGEKVDYAVMQDGKPIMIIECKACGVNLEGSSIKKQLDRYYSTLTVSIGILTDGIRYLFFSTGEDGKKTDAIPFMEFSLDNVDDTLLPELRKLCKGKFDIKTTLDTVNELKFNRQIKLLLARNLSAPEENFVRYFVKECGGMAEQKTLDAFTAYIKRAFNEFVEEQVDSRLKNALAASSKNEVPQVEVEPENKSITTEDEWQAYYLVKSILMGTVPSERVVI
jgi:hypothetical protein